MISDKKVAIVTGGTGKIGAAICLKLAELQVHVIIVGRNQQKCEKTVEDIILKTNNKDVEYEVVDLSSFAQIKQFAQRYKKSGKQLHMLINNAAIVPQQKELSSEGIELQFAVNVMSYYWMIREFQEILISSAPSRVVNVASTYAGDLDLQDLQYQTRQYDKNSAYRQSKQANRMLTIAHAERLEKYSVTVNSCHPGVVPSNVSSGLGFGGWESPEKGAETPVWLATDKDKEKVTGKLFSAKKRSTERYAKKKDEIEGLFRFCEELTLKLEQ